MDEQNQSAVSMERLAKALESVLSTDEIVVTVKITKKEPADTGSSDK